MPGGCALHFSASTENCSPPVSPIVYQLVDRGQTVRVAAIRHRGVAYQRGLAVGLTPPARLAVCWLHRQITLTLGAKSIR